METNNVTEIQRLTPFYDSIIERYLANDVVPRSVQIAFEQAKRVFGEQFVSIEVGFSNYHESLWKDCMYSTIKYMSIPRIILNTTYNHDFRTLFDGSYPASTIINVMSYVVQVLGQRSYNCWSRVALMIYLPKRTIKNEKNETIDIQDLFVRIPFKNDGTLTGGLYYARTTYTVGQWIAQYRHSHTPHFAHIHADYFDGVCTGSGPINQTMDSLQASRNIEDEIQWGLFFWELDKIINIESEVGGPYAYMNTVGSMGSYVAPVVTLSSENNYKWFDREQYKEFLSAYLNSGHFKVAFQNGGFCLTTPVLEWVIDFSTFMLKWTGKNNPLIPTQEIKVLNNRIVTPDTVLTRETLDLLEGYKQKKSIIFKGKAFSVKVSNLLPDEEEGKKLTIVNLNFCVKVLYVLLQTLNYKYEKRHILSQQRDWQDFKNIWEATDCITGKTRILF